MKGRQKNVNKEATWESDLNEAYVVENKLKEIFENNWECTGEVYHAAVSFPDYDVKINFKKDNSSLAFEVKQDKMVNRTGNIAVEVERTMCDGTVKPTCISISKADIYAYYINEDFYLIETDKLRKMIADKKYYRMVSGAGDGNRATVALFKKDVFINNSESLNKIVNGL